jgi:hypothetical protein
MKTLTFEEVEAKLPKGKWWHFNQNNSGGSYFGPKNVLIAAETEEEAREILEEQPDYTSQSCECCGARWGMAWEQTQEEAVQKIVDWSDDQHWDNTFCPDKECARVLGPFDPSKKHVPLTFGP